MRKQHKFVICAIGQKLTAEFSTIFKAHWVVLMDKAAAFGSLPHSLRGHNFSFIGVVVQVTRIPNLMKKGNKKKKKIILHNSRCHMYQSNPPSYSICARWAWTVPNNLVPLPMKNRQAPKHTLRNYTKFIAQIQIHKWHSHRKKVINWNEITAVCLSLNLDTLRETSTQFTAVPCTYFQRMRLCLLLQ